MKIIIVLSLAAMAVAVQYYSSENDDIDIEEVVADNEALKAFYDCFMDQAACDDVTGFFKVNLQEVFAEACAKCTEAQKHMLRRFLEEMQHKFPYELELLKSKYDPNGQYYYRLLVAIALA